MSARATEAGVNKFKNGRGDWILPDLEIYSLFSTEFLERKEFWQEVVQCKFFQVRNMIFGPKLSCNHYFIFVCEFLFCRLTGKYIIYSGRVTTF